MDQLLTYLAAFTGLASLLISICQIWSQRRVKSLSYVVLEQTPLVRVDKRAAARIRYSFDYKDASELYLVKIKVMNDGTDDIVAADYERPLGFSLGAKTSIFAASVVDTTPTSLTPVLTYPAKLNLQPARVLIEPVLIHPGEAFTIELILAYYYSRVVAPQGRIQGVRQIIQRQRGFERQRAIVGLLGLLGLDVLIMGFYTFALARGLDVPSVANFMLMMVMLGIAFSANQIAGRIQQLAAHSVPVE